MKGKCGSGCSITMAKFQAGGAKCPRRQGGQQKSLWKCHDKLDVGKSSGQGPTRGGGEGIYEACMHTKRRAIPYPIFSVVT